MSELRQWTCALEIRGRAVVVVLAEDEEEAVRKAEEYDPWDLTIEVSDATCDEAVPEEVVT